MSTAPASKMRVVVADRGTGPRRVPTKNQPAGALGPPPRRVPPKPDQTRPVRPGSLQHAFEVAEYGFAVFPLRKKRPFGGSHGHLDAVKDPEEIRALWRRYRGGDGVGIATGSAGGVWGLDVDVKDGKVGHQSLADLVSRYGPLPRTVQGLTPTGGSHILFADDPRVRLSTGNLPKDLDVRGNGGYLVAPGSLHDRGGLALYRWDPDHHPDDTPIAEAPPWLIDLVDPPVDAAGRGRASRGSFSRRRGGRYGEQALANEIERVARAQYGERNRTLNHAAFRLGQLIPSGTVDVDSAWDALVLMAEQVGLPRSEAENTIASGVLAGACNPRRS
jgi:putative DNA primase/helicase